MSKGSKIQVKIIENKLLDYKLKGTIYESVEEYMPKLKHSIIVFELHNTCRQFANAIRRCLTNELELKYMTVDMNDIDVPHGTSIVKEDIKQRLECIPLLQSVPENETFKLSVSNNTESIMNVYTGSIQPQKNKKEMYFNPRSCICSINPNEYICIDNIYIKKVTGKDNGRVSLGCVGYEIINHDMKVSSMNSDPTSFKLSLKTHGNFENTCIPIQLAIANLIARLERIEKALNAKKEDDADHGIHYSIGYDAFKLHISNEKYTIGMLLQKYVYMLDPSEIVGLRDEHPTKNYIILDLKHKNPKKICIDAINAIKEDLNVFGSYFKVKKNDQRTTKKGAKKLN